MSTPPTNLDLVITRLETDWDFFQECRRQLGGKQGDEALLALVNFAAGHGYQVTFQEAREARKRAIALEAASFQTMEKALKEVRGEAAQLRDFFKQW